MAFLKDVLRGVFIGAANIIPGVSGGTMMVSMGIYDKIIASVNRIFKEFTKSVKTLLPYFIGMLLGIVGLSFVIEYLFGSFPLPTALLFIGLIIGGLPVLVRNMDREKINAGCVGLFFLFLALVIGLQFLNEGQGMERIGDVHFTDMLVLFAVGVVAAATMVVPGVSGSMVLMSLGYYNPILNEVNSCIRALKGFQMSELIHGVLVMAPFCLGVLLGILAIARLIEYLLKRFKNYTYSAILGLVAASVVVVLIGVGAGSVTAGMVILSCVTFAAGFAVSFFMGKM